MEVIERLEARLVFRVDSSLFPEAVLFKCFYWYGDRFTVDIDRDPDGERIRVSLTALGSPPDWPTIEARIRRDLVDFRTRQLVADETRPIRELIAAKAFAAIDPLPLEPPGSVSDPVGFDPSDFDEPAD